MCCQINAFSEKRIRIKTGSLSVLHLCVSLRANLNFFEHVQFKHGYGSKKFQNVKTGTNYLELHRTC